MPQSYTPIELWEVKPHLTKKGYQFHQTRLWAVQLTKPDPHQQFKDTRAPVRNRLAGISKENLNKILLYSSSVSHAAQQIEEMSLGTKLAPDEPSNVAPQGIDEEQIKRLAEAYAENLAAKRDNEQVASLQEELAESRAMLLEMQAQLKAMQEAPPATTRGAKKKRGKKAAAKKAPAPKKEENTLQVSGELTPEQQSLLDETLRNMNPSNE